MKIPIVYNVRSVLQRPVSTALTALGIALVVAVFIGMLALANGFRTALVRTGSDRNVLVLGAGPIPSCRAAWRAKRPAFSRPRPTSPPAPMGSPW